LGGQSKERDVGRVSRLAGLLKGVLRLKKGGNKLMADGNAALEPI
jgi:hypothetical protein